MHADLERSAVTDARITTSMKIDQGQREMHDIDGSSSALQSPSSLDVRPSWEQGRCQRL